MREIKFRAWNGHRMSEPFAPYDINSLHIKKSNLLLLYTGRKDRTGAEIYEGDIVQDGGETGTVIYKPGHFEVVSGANECSWLAGWDDCVVIGNIYENPELLAPTLERNK